MEICDEVYKVIGGCNLQKIGGGAKVDVLLHSDNTKISEYETS